MEVLDFSNAQFIPTRGYSGNAGQKNAYYYNGVVWMVKFPQSTANFKGKHLPSYTTSPISEYIGSHVYELLGVDVHETQLVFLKDKIAVACRDFESSTESKLMDFASIKNMVSEDSISGSLGSSARGERLNDVLSVLESAPVLNGMNNLIIERFWQMFIVDAFILNNDRNNGNWGLLTKGFEVHLAPVFDNGNAFFNKRNNSFLETRMESEASLTEDVNVGTSFFTDDKDHHIHPFKYLGSGVKAECKDALRWFLKSVDLAAVQAMITEMPEESFGLRVIANEQKEYYCKILEKTYERLKQAL